MSILKRQVGSSSIFVSFFIVMTHNAYVNFKLIHFLLWTIGSHQSSNSDTFKCSDENLPNSSFLMAFFLQILHYSLMAWEITHLYFFSSYNIYFAQKEPIKVNFFWDFQVLRSKFVKFFMPILKQQVDSSPNFVSLFSFMKDNFPVLFYLKQYILCSKGGH